MRKYIIALIFLVISCTPQPIIVNQTVNSCNDPGPIEYYEFNDTKYNDEIENLVVKWPVHLQEYLHLKMNNRIVQHERCISYTIEQVSYSRCLLFLIEAKENDKNNK